MKPIYVKLITLHNNQTTYKSSSTIIIMKVLKCVGNVYRFFLQLHCRMDYINIVIFTEIFLLVSAALSFVVDQKSCKLIYQISFALTFFVILIKYYFSSDIASYVPYYENIPILPSLDLKAINNDSFETGFTVFCSILKTSGFSYWFMTAIVTIFSFHSLHRLLGNFSPMFRTIGLVIFFVVGWDLFMQQFRQAMAVSFFFYALSCAIDGKTPAKVALLSLISCTFHDSAIFINMPLLVCLYFNKNIIKISRSAFVGLFVVFIICMFIDFEWVINKIADIAGLSIRQKYSLEFHFGIHKLTQSVLLIYIPVFIALSTLKDDRTDIFHRILRILTFIGMAYVAVFYKYNLFINRFSNYVIMVSILYTMDLLRYYLKSIHPIRNCKLAYQAVCCLSIMFMAYKTIPHVLSLPNQYVYKNTPTVFSTLFLNDSKVEQIKQTQLDKANYFWKNELTGMYERTSKSFQFSQTND